MKSPQPLGPVVRVGAALLLCAACFQAGRWTGRLERGAVDTAFAAATEAALGALPAKAPVEAAPKLVEAAAATSAQGDPVGEKGDIITPLNVRDPSALVIGPGASSYCPSVPPPPPDAPKPLKLKNLRKGPLPEGKLLDLLKKHKDKPDEPKVY